MESEVVKDELGLGLSFLYKRWNKEAYKLPHVPYLSEAEAAWERNYFNATNHTFTEQGQWLWAFPIGLLYVIATFCGQAWMKNRPRFELRNALFIWNMSLAVFSVFVASRRLPEHLDLLINHSFHASVCNARMFSGPSALYALLFALSKVPEMGDTAFIVLRKQPLIFLHWYHHLVTMIYCMLCIVNQAANARYFMDMNLVVHSLMYTYYALKAKRVRIPRWISMIITTLQLSQMFVAIFVSWYAWRVKLAGVHCEISYESLTIASTMYASYAVLFAHYFYKAYLSPKPRPTSDGKKADGHLVTNGEIHMTNGHTTVRKRNLHQNTNGNAHSG